MPDWNCDGFDDITGEWVGVGGSSRKETAPEPVNRGNTAPSTDAPDSEPASAEPRRPRRVRRV